MTTRWTAWWYLVIQSFPHVHVMTFDICTKSCFISWLVIDFSATCQCIY